MSVGVPERPVAVTVEVSVGVFVGDPEGLVGGGSVGGGLAGGGLLLDGAEVFVGAGSVTVGERVGNGDTNVGVRVRVGVII